jgi:hypothetical protein
MKHKLHQEILLVLNRTQTPLKIKKQRHINFRKQQHQPMHLILKMVFSVTYTNP